MYQQVTEQDFIDAFRTFGRLDTGDGTGGNFTPEGCRALFGWLEELEEDIGEPIQLDVIVLCCDYAEHDDAMDAIREHMNAEERAELFSDCTDGDEIREAILDWFRDQTTVIEVDGTDRIIIQAF